MAQTTGNHIPLILASQGALSYIEDASSTDLSGALSSITAVTDKQVIMCKDMTITMPQQEAEKVDLLGKESTTAGSGVLNTGNYQNQIYDIKSVSDAEISGTMALTLHNDGDSAALPDFIDISTGDGLAISTTHHRHTFGDDTTNQTKQLTGLIMVVFDNGTQAGTVAMLNPVVNLNEITATGEDGHFELSFTARSLAKNFALEIADQD